MTESQGYLVHEDCRPSEIDRLRQINAELLAALDELLRWHHSKDDCLPVAKRARAAIAKAEQAGK